MRVLRRLVCSLFVFGMVSAALSAVPAAAAPKEGLVDFDGDGLVDVAAGAYTRVDVAYGSGHSSWIEWSSISKSEVTNLGHSMAAHDLNGDGYTDLVVSAPNYSMNKKGGAVFILYGSENGLRTDNVRRLASGATYGDSLGWTVAVMVGRPTLIVAGAPELTVSGRKRAGGLVVWPVDDAGVPGKRTIVTENSSGIPGTSEAGDGFGQNIAASGSTLVVGTPYENVGKVADAGSVTVLERRGAVGFKGVTVTQNSAGVPGSAERYDQFGSAVAIDRGWIVASAPGESIGKHLEVGSVHTFRYQAGSLKPKPGPAFNQNSAGVPGGNERIDHFGEHLLILRCGAGASVAVGTPLEAIGKKSNAGLVTVVPLGSGSSCPARAYDGSDFGGAVQSDGVLGRGLGLVRAPSADHDDLLAVTTKRLDTFVGRVNPATGGRAGTYPALWGGTHLTGFAQPAS